MRSVVLGMQRDELSGNYERIILQCFPTFLDITPELRTEIDILHVSSQQKVMCPSMLRIPPSPNRTDVIFSPTQSLASKGSKQYWTATACRGTPALPHPSCKRRPRRHIIIASMHHNAMMYKVHLAGKLQTATLERTQPTTHENRIENKLVCLLTFQCQILKKSRH